MLALLLTGGLFSRAAGQTAGPPVLTSPGPDHVSITLYRNPDRSPGDEIDLEDAQGFALVTETRTIDLPAGEAVIRFEGVSGNLFPESAIVEGLPQGVIEKNLDADLLSPRTLFDRSLGRRVLIRRTHPKTGKVVVEQAVIRSSADGAAVIQTAEGVRALKCDGMSETILYPQVPAGLSDKPTLSVATRSPVARRVTLTLAYLAGGFDWQADYVVQMRPDGHRADMFAWVTMASSDVTSFARADAQVVAGRLNREERDDIGVLDADNGTLELKCTVEPPPAPVAPPPMVYESYAAAPVMMRAEAQDIIVTGARRVSQEELGDLKLYRLPDRVTVSARAQKQVALLAKDAVPMATVYVDEIYEGSNNGPMLTLRATNRKEAGLGLPLPAGKVAVLQTGEARPILVGETTVADKAVGENVEYKLRQTPNVTSAVEELRSEGSTTVYALTVTNANRWPVAYEAKIAVDSNSAVSGNRVIRRDGKWLWATTVPANGTATLHYSITEPE